MNGIVYEARDGRTYIGATKTDLSVRRRRHLAEGRRQRLQRDGAAS